MYIDTRELDKQLNDYEDMLMNINDIREEINDIREEINATDDQDDIDSFNDDINSLYGDIEMIHDDFNEENYDVLCEMRNEIPEWENGNTLISDDDFIDYAMDMLSDCGEFPAAIPWYIVIDEEATANNIKQDYSCIEYEGVDYWYRNC